MKASSVALLGLLALLLVPGVAYAAVTDATPEGAPCVYRTEHCPVGYGTVYVVCSTGTKVPLCFIATDI